MPSKNTLYVAITKSVWNQVDTTMGYVVQGSNLYGPMGGSGQHLARNFPIALDTDALTLVQAMHQRHGVVGWAENDAGVYTPRLYRGSWQGWGMLFPPLQSDAEKHEYLTATEQEEILSGDLAEIARTVSPDQNNRTAWGSRVRNLLIVACTEAESQMKGIMKANGYTPIGKHFNTTDYVKLLKPMRLDEYALRLTRYRDYGVVEPFKGWNSAAASASLPWYDAYNATKHDRELNFSRATLEHAISAVGALSVLLLAQYGPDALSPLRNAFFGLEARPEWDHKDRTYPPAPGGAWTPVPHAF